MKILHVITGLSTGGAEMMLYKLLSRIDRDRFDCEVVSLTNLGEIADRIGRLDIPVTALGMKRGHVQPLKLLQLSRLIRLRRSDMAKT